MINHHQTKKNNKKTLYIYIYLKVNIYIYIDSLKKTIEISMIIGIIVVNTFSSVKFHEGRLKKN